MASGDEMEMSGVTEDTPCLKANDDGTAEGRTDLAVERGSDSKAEVVNGLTAEGENGPAAGEANGFTSEGADGPTVDGENAPIAERVNGPTPERATGPAVARANGPTTEEENGPTSNRAKGSTTAGRAKSKGCCSNYKIHNPDGETIDGNPRKVARIFRTRASLPGITDVMDSPGGVKRMIWIVVCVGALIALVVHMVCISYSFGQYETTSEIEYKTEKIKAFPAVTICNNNMVVENKSNSGQDEEDLDFIGHHLSDMFVNASFDNHILNLTNEDFKHFPNAVYGNCYTFNYNATEKTRRALPGYGLEMILNIEGYKYKKYHNDSSYEIAKWKGMVIKVHHPGTEPIMDEGEIILSSNTVNRLAVKSSEITRLGGKYGDCKDEHKIPPPTFYSGHYTRQQCENTCLQREVIETCRCYLKTMNKDFAQFDESYDSCQDNETECWSGVLDRYNNGSLSCDQCTDLCKEVMYDTSTVSAQWPSDQYMEHKLIDKLTPSPLWEAEEGKLDLDHLKRQLLYYNVSADGNITKEFIRENLVKVQIYYESMITVYIKSVPVVRAAEFVSELGAAFTFWAGWSVWTAFQFMEFVADFCVVSKRKKKDPQDTEAIVEETDEAEAQSPTAQSPATATA